MKMQSSFRSSLHEATDLEEIQDLLENTENYEIRIENYFSCAM